VDTRWSEGLDRAGRSDRRGLFGPVRRRQFPPQRQNEPPEALRPSHAGYYKPNMFDDSQGSECRRQYSKTISILKDRQARLPLER
jgi:hypothetical protein